MNDNHSFIAKVTFFSTYNSLSIVIYFIFNRFTRWVRFNDQTLSDFSVFRIVKLFFFNRLLAVREEMKLDNFKWTLSAIFDKVCRLSNLTHRISFDYHIHRFFCAVRFNVYFFQDEHLTSFEKLWRTECSMREYLLASVG